MDATYPLSPEERAEEDSEFLDSLHRWALYDLAHKHGARLVGPAGGETTVLIPGTTARLRARYDVVPPSGQVRGRIAFAVGPGADLQQRARQEVMPLAGPQLAGHHLLGNRMAVGGRWLGTFGAVELEDGIGLALILCLTPSLSYSRSRSMPS
jgi:hypothetical protein